MGKITKHVGLRSDLGYKRTADEVSELVRSLLFYIITGIEYEGVEVELPARIEIEVVKDEHCSAVRAVMEWGDGD